MSIVDKIQGGIEKLTNDDTKLNAAETVAVQQAYNALQLGLVKTEFYMNQVQNADVKEALRETRDDFIKPNLDKPRRILEKAGIPSYNMQVEGRVQTMAKNVPRVFTDEEVLLDTILSLQASVTGMQAGALVAVRGDVRDYFLSARDAAFEQWRKFGFLVYKQAPQIIPPIVAGTTTAR